MTIAAKPPLEVLPGQVWRGRLIVDGPGQYVSATFIMNQLESLGAGQAWVWASPQAKSFPRDWRKDKLDNAAGFLERQWFCQIRFEGFPGEPQSYPQQGPNWRIHDAWLYLDVSGVLPDPTDEDYEIDDLIDDDDDEPYPYPPVPEPEPEPEPDPDPEAELPPDPPFPFPETVPPVPPGTDIGDYAGKPQNADLDIWAGPVLIEAFRQEMGRLPTPRALRSIQAVGRHEGYYGWATRPPQWPGNHNWGAITCKCPCGFTAGDSYYVNGKLVRYETCFAKQPTNLAGARHLVRVLIKNRQGVQDVMDDGNLTSFARAMRDTNYFCRTTGKGKDGKPSCSAATDAQKQDDAVRYAKALNNACIAIGKKATNGDQICYLDGPPPPMVSEPTPSPPHPPHPPPAVYTRAGALASATLVVVGIAAVAIGQFASKR